MTTSNSSTKLEDYIKVDTDVIIEKGGSQREVGRVVGLRKPSFFMVELTQTQMQPFAYLPEESCVVRFLQEGQVLGFRAEVIKVIHEPFMMLIMEYPDKFQMITIRKAVRIPCYIPVSMRVPNEEEAKKEEAPHKEETAGKEEEKKMEGPFLKGRILDMSEGGFRMVFPVIQGEHIPADMAELYPDLEAEDAWNHRAENLNKHFKAQQAHHVRFELPDPGRGLFTDVQGEVSWVKPKGNHLCIGFKILYPSARLKTGIQKIVENQMTYFMRSLSPELV